MPGYQDYRTLFDKEIVQRSKGIIFSFSPLCDTHIYQPYCHSISADAVEKLGELMRHDLLFYSYGEDEVIDYYKKGAFPSLQNAAKYAYKYRLPHRNPARDGLPGEVLLDLLVQIYNPNAHKLAVRTIFRQADNNEIKGYDLTYFSKDDSGISLWLGQAKLGGKSYCMKGIDKDLIEKYATSYLSKQLYFVCDKRISISENAKSILEEIETINLRTFEDDEAASAQRLIDHLNKRGIRVKIPCLLAYEGNGVYQDAAKLYERLMAEAEDMKTFFNGRHYKFTGFLPDIVFYVFPIESIDRLRDKENGFYAGLF